MEQKRQPFKGKKMNWDNGLVGMVCGGLVLRPPWEFRVLVGLIVFFALRSAFKWIVRQSREDLLEQLSRLTRLLRAALAILLVCTGALFAATCGVGMAGKPLENATLLAMFLRLSHCTFVSLCVTGVAALLLVLLWPVRAIVRSSARPTCKLVSSGGAGEEKRMYDEKENADQEE